MKFLVIIGALRVRRSPSMRREWIEIDKEEKENDDQKVSLHAEGVD